MGFPLGAESGYQRSSEGGFRSCSFEERRLADDDLQRRSVESQAASACLFDPVGATCQDFQVQLGQIKLEVDRDWRALDRCQHDF